MSDERKGPCIYAGVSHVDIEGDAFDLGDGVTVSKVYSHLMAPFILALRPAKPGEPHPGPWKHLPDGLSFDITAEIRVPEKTPIDHENTLEVAKTVLFLIRLGINPEAALPVFSNHSFKDLASLPDDVTRLLPFEVMPKHFPLTSPGTLNARSMEWVKTRWKTVMRLTKSHPEFALAREAIDQGQYVNNSALALVSLWAAFEALFAPSPSELRFRVSALMATYLEPPGAARSAMQKKIASLYDKRSAAAHGMPKHKDEDLLESFILMQRVLGKIIEDGSIPSKVALEASLFGA